MDKPRIADTKPCVLEITRGKYAFCTCGESSGQPFCDGSHAGGSFTPQIFEMTEDKTVAHGPVEVLLTVDEERGLTGAAGVQAGFFKSRKMINLDSEEDQAIFVGCAGGRDTQFTLKNRSTRAPKDSAGRKVTISGLKGGHSGLDIHQHRGNAIKILTRALLAAAQEMEVRIVEIDGGSMRNAIPREAEAKVVIARDQGRKFKQTVDACLKQIQSRCGLRRRPS